MYSSPIFPRIVWGEGGSGVFRQGSFNPERMVGRGMDDRTFHPIYIHFTCLEERPGFLVHTGPVVRPALSVASSSLYVCQPGAARASDFGDTPGGDWSPQNYRQNRRVPRFPPWKSGSYSVLVLCGRD